MAGKETVGAICWRSNPGSGDKDGPKFIRCVDGWELQIYEVWTFGEDGVTPEVHLTEQVDVGAGFIVGFSTNCLTEDGRRIPMFGVNSINVSIQWLGVPTPLRTDGPTWTDIILVPSPAWGTGGTVTNSN